MVTLQVYDINNGTITGNGVMHFLSQCVKMDLDSVLRSVNYSRPN